MRQAYAGPYMVFQAIVAEVAQEDAPVAQTVVNLLAPTFGKLAENKIGL